jgi:leucine dehydrogenase
MKIDSLTQPGYETVLRITDGEAGLTGFIAIHSTALGPAAGGLRMREYASEAAALQDVLALARGMTLKNAAAGLPLGGGKAVILGAPSEKTEAQLRAMGRAIDTLGGRYWTAEDMGMTPADMQVVRQETEFVAGLPDGPYASGDPSPRTARGVFYAMRVAAERRFGARDLAGRRVAIQGLGHVGWHLAKLLRAAGAELIVSDIDTGRADQAAWSFGATAVTPEDILTVPADIFAPCAIGGVITEEVAARLPMQMVCGAANNQLASDAAGDVLHERGILYAPDYVANGGGIINVAAEILRVPDRMRFVSEHLAALEAMMAHILAQAAQTRTAPHRIADRIVTQRLAPSDEAA